MTIQVVPSHHGVPIRLTEDRWQHILEKRPQFAGRQADILGHCEV